MNIARVLFDTLAHVRPVWRGTVPGSRETRGLCHSRSEAEMLERTIDTNMTSVSPSYKRAISVLS